MLNDRLAQPCAASKRFRHQSVVRDTIAVVAESKRPRLRHPREVSKGAPLPPLGDAADRMDPTLGDFIRASPNPADDLGVIQRRLGVGHASDSREPACNGGGRSALDGFFALATRFAEMHVQIDESRHDQQTRRIEHILGVDASRRNFGDETAFDEQIGLLNTARPRIDDGPPFDGDGGLVLHADRIRRHAPIHQKPRQFAQGRWMPI